MLQSAEVLSRAAATDRPEAWEWALTALRQFPGSALACAGTADGCVAVLRDGRRAVVIIEAGDLDVAALAACLYALAREQRLAAGDWQVRTSSASRSPASINAGFGPRTRAQRRARVRRRGCGDPVRDPAAPPGIEADFVTDRSFPRVR